MGDRLGRTLAFLPFSPDRLREAAEGTTWTVERVRHRDSYYRAVLTAGTPRDSWVSRAEYP